MQIRADLADCGVYIISNNCYRLMNYVIQEKDPEWLDISEDLIPFLAKN